MAMQLSEVVPFGRSRREYELMFNLSQADLEKRILGCADGPASFNAEMHRDGYSVTSADPLYAFRGSQITQRFDACVDEVMSQVETNRDKFVWKFHRDPTDLIYNRRYALQRFVTDYDADPGSGRYVNAALPDLPFDDGAFELALCSHFLFLYSDHFDRQFHIDALLEMLRLAPEARVFPVLTLACERSPHLEPVCEHLSELGFNAVVEPVAYEFQKGGNEMLRVSRA